MSHVPTNDYRRRARNYIAERWPEPCGRCGRSYTAENPEVPRKHAESLCLLCSEVTPWPRVGAVLGSVRRVGE